MALHPCRPLPDPAWAVLEVENFAAQAIGALQPPLRDTAFAVIQQRGDHHKSALHSVSHRALEMGVTPGMPVFVLRRKFGRRVTVIRRDEASEAHLQGALASALSRWSPAIDLQFSRGTFAAVIDLAGTPAARLWEGRQLGQKLRQHVERRCSIRVGVGVAAGRLAARLVVRAGDADGVGVCTAAEEADLLRQMATDDLPGLAASCRERAALYGLNRVDQVLQLDRSALVRRFGRDDGLRLYGLVRGLEPVPRVRSTMNPVHGPQSMSLHSGTQVMATSSTVAAATTHDAATQALPCLRNDSFGAETVLEEDLNDDVALRQALRLTVDKTCHLLRSGGQVSQALTVRLMYTDNRSRQKTALLPTGSDEYGTLCRIADGLFHSLHTRRVALKSLAIRAGRTTPSTGQGDLFAGPAEARRQRLAEAITAIRQRMGFDAVGTARDRLSVPGSSKR